MIADSDRGARYTPAVPILAVISRRWWLAVLGLALVGCAAKPLAQPSWPAPSDPMKLSRDAGFEPTDREYLTTHTHAHLDVFVDGQRVQVPGGIGLDVAAPKGIEATKTPDGSGMDYQVSVCDAPCLSELHTHTPDGLVHTESSKIDVEPHTLGQFFIEWGLRLDDSCIGEYCKPDTSADVYLDGKKHEGNPAEIKLAPHVEVAIVIGKPPAFIPDSWSFLPGQ
jgi:hypothetical protein